MNRQGDLYLGRVVNGRLSDVKVGSETSQSAFYTGNVDNPTVTANQLSAAPAAAFAAPTIVTPADGDQALSAAAGSTLFDFSDVSFGHDTISRFDPAQDTIWLPSTLAAGFTEVQSDMSAIAGGTLIALDATHSIALDGIAPANMTAANFRCS